MLLLKIRSLRLVKIAKWGIRVGNHLECRSERVVCSGSLLRMRRMPNKPILTQIKTWKALLLPTNKILI